MKTERTINKKRVKQTIMGKKWNYIYIYIYIISQLYHWISKTRPYSVSSQHGKLNPEID